MLLLRNEWNWRYCSGKRLELDLRRRTFRGLTDPQRNHYNAIILALFLGGRPSDASLVSDIDDRERQMAAKVRAPSPFFSTAPSWKII